MSHSEKMNWRLRIAITLFFSISFKWKRIVQKMSVYLVYEQNSFYYAANMLNTGVTRYVNLDGLP